LFAKIRVNERNGDNEMVRRLGSQPE